MTLNVGGQKRSRVLGDLRSCRRPVCTFSRPVLIG